MTNQLASLARRDYFYLDAFWRVNLGMYIIILFKNTLECMIAEGKCFCGASLQGFPVWTSNPTLCFLSFAKYTQDGHLSTVRPSFL